MATTIWQGTVSSPVPGSSIAFTVDPVTGAITQASTSGPITFSPAAGYAALTGAFSSMVAFPPGGFPADPAAAWAAAAAKLLLLDPAKTYIMTIAEE